MRKLPPLNPLRAFEVAGRVGSIRKAADELSVTPGAVSRQVKALETYLGLRLFRRDPQEIVLTADGEQYLADIKVHLEGIRVATEKLMGVQVGEVLKVHAHTTFTMKWLIPRLDSFHKANKNTEVRLTTSNETIDFDRESVDCAIRLGDGSWSGVEVDKLMVNELVPLCSPEFLRDQNLSSVADLAHVTRLHSLVRPDDWGYWLASAAPDAGIDPYAGDKYASSVLAYQAALQGHGIFMAQRALFEDDIERGRLVQPFEHALDRGNFTYYVIYPRLSLRNPALRRFRVWLLEEAGRDASLS